MVANSTVNDKYDKEPAETVKFLVVLKNNESTETENEPAKNDESAYENEPGGS